MKVGVDARSLTAGRGVARYTRRMLAALAAAYPEDEFRLFVAGRAPVDLPHPAIVVRRDARPQRALFGAAALVGRPRLDELLGGDLDVVWVPAPAPLALSPGFPFVLTVHDLSFEERPRDFTPYERLWHRLARIPALAARATRVVCDSAATRAVLERRWGLTAAIVAPGVDRPDAPPPPPPTGMPERYVLAVGALEPRKAPELLARAHARARTHGLGADLVFAGAGRLASAVAGPGVHVLGHVDDAQLEALYAHALALAMPSWLEGFGLPPLEALAHGTPAIVSDLAVYDETLGDGALRVPAGDEQALADAMLRLARDPQLRAQLVEAGQRAIAPLTWERAARELHATLTEAAAA